jgi:predicted AAA+ superfamily ATPase
MAKSNRDRVGEIMDALKEGLGPFVLREFNATYGTKRFLQEVEQTLTTNAYSAEHLLDVQTALERVDAQGWLNLMSRKWDDVFRSKLGRSERSYVHELIDARNDWAHQKPFTNDEAYRTADTATRLLEAVGAPDPAQIARAAAQELLRLRFETEAKQAKKQTGPLNEAKPLTSPGLKPWRLVVKPHPDVASGRYIQAEFAADLAQVMQGKADPEYGDPKEFFRRTYLTEGLVALLANGVKRLTGQGGDPVVQLQTSFGGGKTHSMLALYHLFSGQIGISEIPGGEAIVTRVEQTDDHIVANRAVIVGTAFSATEPRRYPDATTHTLWGDLAYQLGGVEAYRRVEKADLAGVSPGSDDLVALLEQYGPALIMIDELVAFARNLYKATDRLSAGTFDSVMSFTQSLTEAVKRSSDSLLLVSIPESDIEIGGEGGQAALEYLAKTIGRVEAVWKPVTATESFEIVRRRLFSSEIDYAARDAVLGAFRSMYAANASDFPAGVAEGDYFSRMKAAYPIHPELFDRLYQDWSTLDRFQRTRGVLRLMATVIHRLWQDNDQALLILPCSIPLWAATVRNEVLRYLPENWPAIVDTDIDGEEARPYQIDKSVPTQGQYTACRRVARTIFVGSAPSVGQSVRGLEEVRIRLGTVQPGEPLAVFGDALRRMSNQLTYLYNDGNRYWYDTRPTVNRIAQDRAQNIHADDVYQEAMSRLRKVAYRREDFAAAHLAPQTSGDIADEWRARVVVLAPEYAHKRGDDSSDAMRFAREVLENRGNAPRLYRNMLVFIAPDENDAGALDKALREYLAWQSIQNDSEPLNLDRQQQKQVTTALARTEETVKVRLQETYSWLLVPAQPEATGSIELQAFRISGQDNFYERAIRKLRQGAQLINKWSPDNLRIELDTYLWRDQPHVGIKQLWDYFARYCYLPRLFDQDVLLDAVSEGVGRLDAPFGYATMVALDGSYKGLVFRQLASTIYFDDQAVLIHPEWAEEQLQATQPSLPSLPANPSAAAPQGISGSTPTEAETTSRYHGTTSLDPQRANREMALIVDEIIQRLTSLPGTAVEITLEISAHRPAGFDDATIRTISENSRTLKFKHHGFEAE